MIGTVRFFRNPSCFRGGNGQSKGHAREQPAGQSILPSYGRGGGCGVRTHACMALPCPVFSGFRRSLSRRRLLLRTAIRALFLHSSHIPAHSPPVEKRREQGRCALASKGPARLRRSGRHRHVRSLCGLRRLRARRCVLPCGRRHDRRLRKRPHGAVAPRRCKATLSFAFALVWRLHDRRRAERCGRQLHHVALGTGNYRMSPCRICAFAGKGIPLAARNRKGRGRIQDPPPPRQKPKILDAMQRRHEQRTASLPSSRKARPNTP